MSITIIPNTKPFVDKMRRKGLFIHPNDLLYIDILNDYILNNNILTSKELTELNHKIVNYLIENKDKTYVEMIKKSKTLKDKVDWEHVEQVYQNELADWDKLLEELTENENYQHLRNSVQR